MTSARLRAVFLALLMAAAFAAAAAWRPTQHLSDMRPKIDLEALFPKSFGEWIVDARMPVQLVSPDTQALLNKIYNQTLSRTYVNQRGERIMLSVAYGGDQSDGTRAHRPEVCYPAQGFSVAALIDAKSDATGYSSPVRRLVAKLGNRVEPITYWIVVGDTIALSGFSQKLAQLSYSVRGTIPDGLLVRVSSIDGDVARAFDVQERFVSDLYKAFPASARTRFFGSPATVPGAFR